MTSNEGEEAPRGPIAVEASPAPVPAQRPPTGAGVLFRRHWTWAALGVIAIAIAVLVGVLVTRSDSSATPTGTIRVSGVPANVPTRVANLMGLSPVQGDHGAPNFTLTDQHGKTLSLSSFRGHPVVLTFMDPHCVTMCPIIAQEFVEADRSLVHSDPGVIFLAVNVNRHALSVATVGDFTKEHQLNTVPTWHFLTGTLATLRRIWNDYGIEVATRIVHGKWTVVHSTIDFFIGPNGKERFIATPTGDYRNTPTHRAYLPSATYASWSRGISLVSRDM